MSTKSISISMHATDVGRVDPTWLSKHGPQLIRCNVLDISDFIWVDSQIDISLDEEDIINLTNINFSLSKTWIVAMYILSCSPHIPSLGAT